MPGRWHSTEVGLGMSLRGAVLTVGSVAVFVVFMLYLANGPWTSSGGLLPKWATLASFLGGAALGVVLLIQKFRGQKQPHK